MKLRRTTDGYVFWCPGCKEVHGVWTTRANAPSWGFNGDMERPTFHPSVRHFTHEEDGSEKTFCHYFIVDGKFNYCGDCDHALNGQQGVEMPEWPYAKGTYGGIVE